MDRDRRPRQARAQPELEDGPLDVGRSIRDLAARVMDLLQAGWREVLVVTNHGWLLLPGGLPKVDLPEPDRRPQGPLRASRAAPTPISRPFPGRSTPRNSIAVAPGIAAVRGRQGVRARGPSPQECVVAYREVVGELETLRILEDEAAVRAIRESSDDDRRELFTLSEVKNLVGEVDEDDGDAES